MNVASAGQAALAAAASAPPPTGDDSRALRRAAFSGSAAVRLRRPRVLLGRERQVFALYRLVENARFIAVVGSSGSGKSSLVLAGLKGLLAEESADPGGPSWVCLEMRPRRLAPCASRQDFGAPRRKGQPR